MSLIELLFNPFILLFIIFILRPLLKWINQKKREEEYFRRMEETIRRANQSKDKPD